MRLRYLAITAGLLAFSLVGAEPVKLTGDWWQAPATATRHTTLVCSFDHGEEADSAREFKASGGFGMTTEPTGAHGAGVKLASLGGHLHFRGGSNFQASHGTVRFAVRGDVWKVQEPRWLFDARGYDRRGVLREPGKLSLVVSPQTRNDSFISRLDLPIGDVSTDTWHYVVGDSRWLEVGLRTGEFILAAQAPEGYWLHGYRMIVKGVQPVTTSANIKLQDQVQADPILLLAYLHRLTGQQRYLDAVKRAGDFYLLAQNPNGSYTHQYDAESRPAWGRHFEPPAYGASATGMAVEALRELYRFSGDKRYPEGIRRASEWIAANLPEGQMSSFMDPESGRAIAAWERKVYFLDDPKSAEFLKTVPFGSNYLSMPNVGATVSRTLQQAEATPPARVLLTAEAARASLPARRASARFAMDSLSSQKL
jgi:hypothetical protein